MPIDFDILSEPRITSETALEELRTAWNAAQSCELDPWEFAVGIGALFRAGVTETELRYLLAKGLAERANEATRPNDTTRRFRSVKSLALDTSACFVITDEGRRLSARDSNEHATKRSDLRCESLLKPFWEAKRRELWLGDVLVKRFTRPARLQELVLAAFQELGWPQFIDDPLPRKSGISPQARRYDVAKNLCRAQKPLQIKFLADRHRQAIHWAVVRRSQTTRPPSP
jgi:hypothetical protein